jgi:hypothetical protein
MLILWDLYEPQVKYFRLFCSQPQDGYYGHLQQLEGGLLISLCKVAMAIGIVASAWTIKANVSEFQADVNALPKLAASVQAWVCFQFVMVILEGVTDYHRAYLIDMGMEQFTKRQWFFNISIVVFEFASSITSYWVILSATLDWGWYTSAILSYVGLVFKMSSTFMNVALVLFIIHNGGKIKDVWCRPTAQELRDELEDHQKRVEKCSGKWPRFKQCDLTPRQCMKELLRDMKYEPDAWYIKGNCCFVTSCLEKYKKYDPTPYRPNIFEWGERSAHQPSDNQQPSPNVTLQSPVSQQSFAIPLTSFAAPVSTNPVYPQSVTASTVYSWQRRV